MTAERIIETMRAWIGKDKRTIIDIYNAHKPLARGYKVKYTDAWCDATVSACFISNDAVDLIGGTECGVEKHIALFKKKGIWQEDGSITPLSVITGMIPLSLMTVLLIILVLLKP